MSYCYDTKLEDTTGVGGIVVQVNQYGPRDSAVLKISSAYGGGAQTSLNRTQLRALIHTLQAAFAFMEPPP